ncbi:hypothetical protein [Metabacillus arenae]|uniref:Uncharacterized protein n=1 Tax=Metabacillus arenae TaxID=2771434 RepID=A0A926S1K7_9BACI|nr:hypothetical protein [Metabacillus arenae]MBD1381109.1 hypothetical protein [Metabacillus arenae]
MEKVISISFIIFAVFLLTDLNNPVLSCFIWAISGIVIIFILIGKDHDGEEKHENINKEL